MKNIGIISIDAEAIMKTNRYVMNIIKDSST